MNFNLFKQYRVKNKTCFIFYSVSSSLNKRFAVVILYLMQLISNRLNKSTLLGVDNIQRLDDIENDYFHILT